MKKKILIISIIIFVILITVSVFVFYKVQEDKQTAKVSLSDTNSTEEKVIEETKEENTTKEELNENTEENTELKTEDKIIENTNDKIIENTKDEVNKNIQIQNNKITNDNNNQETQKKNDLSNEQNKKEDKVETQVPQPTNPVQSIPETKEEPKQEETKQEDPKQEEPKQEIVKVDLSKYDRYEPALNGGYKAYKKSDSEMSKLKGLIDQCIKEFGYTNVKVIPSESIKNTQYFTANKINVENKVYNSEDFTICYYAETEYHITAEGVESIFQYRSYIKVQ